MKGSVVCDERESARTCHVKIKEVFACLLAAGVAVRRLVATVFWTTGGASPRD